MELYKIAQLTKMIIDGDVPTDMDQLLKMMM